MYSGLSRDQVDLAKLVSLVDQTDDHCATLTVRETLAFADTCLNGRIEDRPVKFQGVAALRTELMLYLLGLSACADTVVGDALLRGVSGGEKKRVTVGEMLVGGQSVFLCDEISTGLDSAATFDIMTSLQAWAETLGGTAVVALLQPPPEVVELFEDLLLLSDGYLVYHGPRTSVLSYFTSIGFTCPARVDPADFLVDVTAGRGFAYRNGQVPESSLALTPADFAATFEHSEISRTVTAELLRGFSLPRTFESSRDVKTLQSLTKTAHSKHSSRFAMAFLPSTGILIARQWKLLVRDKSFLYGKLTEAVVVGMVLGMIYYGASSVLYLRMLFFAIAVFQRQAWQQITLAFQLRSVFYKQRSRNFFRTCSYGIADAVVQVPINLVVALVMSSIFYFLSGLVLSPGHFSVFVTILVVYQHAIGAFFAMLSAASPTITMAQALAGISVCFFLLFSGNIILADLIPRGWIWMYWFDPIAWALRAVILNEFYSARYSPEAREEALELFQIRQGPEYIGIGIAILALYYVGFTALNTLILHTVRYDKSNKRGGGGASSSNDDEKGNPKFALLAQASPMSEGIQIKPSHYEIAPSGQHHETFIPAYLTIENLDYTVVLADGTDKQLLHGITANFKPGTITALMGSSGAGKTTLMDVIAGRKTGGSIRGSIMLNGCTKNPVTFSRIAAYCEQMDIHSSSATVLEALLFSANLRLPTSTPEQEKLDLVYDTLALLELTPLKNHIVGSLQSGGLSVEQRKRLTIAVELVANPSILFLDEPTSGLDARSALVVMRGVRSIADSGRTVVCTIHQPSVQIFNLFDSLLLLQRGGHTAFFGELGHDSCKLLEYFASIPGTEDIVPQYNPATYMLEVIGAGIGREASKVQHENENEKSGSSSFTATETTPKVPMKPKNYALEYATSALAATNRLETRHWQTPGPHVQAFPEYDQYATSLWNQIRHTAVKTTRTYWRTPNYNFIRLALYPCFALIFGTTFYQMARTSAATINSQIALIYNTMDFIGVMNLMTVLDITCNERAVFYRERSVNMYSVFPYSFALFLAEVPYLVVISATFVMAEYWLVGLEQQVDNFVFFWFIFFLYISICTFVGQLMCALTPNAKVANVAVGAFSCLLNLFSGYLLPFIEMRSFYKWFIYLMPSSYALNALVSSQMVNCVDGQGNGCETIVGPDGTSTITVADYVVTHYGFDASTRFTDMFILLCIVGITQVAIYLTFRYVNHLKR